MANNPSEKPSDFRSSFSESHKRPSKKIVFKDSTIPFDQPIPSFNADNKQKVAQMKLGNKKIKGILKKNPKYLIPDDIITEQIKKYEQELYSNDNKEGYEEGNALNNNEISEKEKKQLIDSFYFPSSPEKPSGKKEPEITKSVEDGFKYNLIDYNFKKSDMNSVSKENEENKKPINAIKPAKNTIFLSVVNNILIENPFAKLKNKSSPELEHPIYSNKVPYYQEKNDSEKESFVIPQIDKTKKTTESEDSGLFDYDKKQKRTKLQADWTFIEEEKKEDVNDLRKKPNLQINTSLDPITNENQEEGSSLKKIDEKEKSARLKEIEALSTPILKEWPQKVSYNFSLNISKDEKSHQKVKDDLINLTNLSSKKIERNEKEVEPDVETKNQINKLRFFLSNYSVPSDFSRKNELVFTMMNKTVIKHDLKKNLWSYHQFDENAFRIELFAFCSYNNLLILSGGIDPVFGEITKKTFIFNYEDKSLVEKSQMRNARYKHLIMVLGNVAYCMGGCSKGEIGIKNCEKYLINEDKWEGLAPLKVKRSFIRGTLSNCNNFIYILGGNDENSNLIIFIEKYDIMNDCWGLINISNELVITNACKLLLLNKKNYSDKFLDDIIILDKKEGENGVEFKSSLIDLENGFIEEDLEFKLNPENYIVLHQDCLFIFPLDSFEKSDKLSLKTSNVENVSFEFVL